jgi:hypothetical protein
LGLPHISLCHRAAARDQVDEHAEEWQDDNEDQPQRSWLRKMSMMMRKRGRTTAPTGGAQTSSRTGSAGVVLCRQRHGGGHDRVPSAAFDTSRQPGGRAGLRLWCECVVQPSSATDDVYEWGVRRNRSGRSALDCEEFVRRQVVGVL